MNDLGLGIVVSMKDAFSQNAQRVEGSMQSLDATVATASERMTRNLDRIEKGTMMVGTGLALMAAPTALVASTAATQKAIGELASLGVQDLRAIEDAAESFTNSWSGTNKADFIASTYDVKSALSSLSDEAVGVFTSMAALTAKATKATTQEMVGTFTTSYGIFKPIMKDITDMEWATAFSGAMAQTVASFKTNGVQMSDAIKNIGAVASASNIPLQEQLAILGQLQTTMPGSEAGTLYKAFIMKAAEAGETLGLSLVDASGRLKGVVPILQEIKKKYPDLSQAAAQVEIKKAFGSDEAVKFLLQMSAGVGALETNIQSVGQAMRTGTVVTEKMAAAMNQDIGARFTLIGQQIANLSEILGRTILPVVNPILSGISRFIILLQDAARSMPVLTGSILTLSMAFGGILVGAGGVMAAIGMVGVALPAIKAGFLAISAVAASTGATIVTWFLPVTAIIAGVVLAVFLLKRAWESNFGGIRDIVMGSWNKVKLAFNGIRTLVTSLSGGVGQVSAEMAASLKEAGLFGFVVGVFRVYYRVKEILGGMATAFSHAFGRIRAILEPAVKGLLAAYGSLYKAIFSVVEIFGVVATTADGAIFRSLGATIGTTLGVIAQVGAYLFRFAIIPLTMMVQGLALVVRAVIWTGKVIIGSFLTAGKFLYKFFLPLRLLGEAAIATGKIFYSVWQILSGDVSILAGLQDIGSAVFNLLATPFQWVRDIVLGVWNFISGIFKGIGGFIGNIAGQIGSALLNLPIVSTLQNIFTSVHSFLAGDLSFFAAGKKLLMTLGEGIWSAATYPFTMLKKVLGKLRNLLPFSDAKEGPLSALSASGSALLETLASGMQQAKGVPVKIFASAAQGIKDSLGNVWESIRGGTTSLLSGLPNTFKKIDQSGVASRPSPVIVETILNLLPKLDNRLLPTAFSAALFLQPVIAGATPQVQVSQQTESSMSTAPQVTLPELAINPLLNPLEQPSLSVSSPEVEKQVTQKNVTPIQSEKLAIVHQAQNNSSATNDSYSSLRSLLEALLSRFDSLAERPIEVSVATNIDGRKIAEAVYKDLREQKVRNYETL